MLAGMYFKTAKTLGITVPQPVQNRADIVSAGTLIDIDEVVAADRKYFDERVRVGA